LAFLIDKTNVYTIDKIIQYIIIYYIILYIILFSGKRANLFTTAMFNGYSPPPGFCFDVLCADEPMIDDPDSPDYNIDRRVRNIINIVECGNNQH